jgi:hypothetical protein
VKQPAPHPAWTFLYRNRCLVSDLAACRAAEDLRPMESPCYCAVLTSRRMRSFLQHGLLHGREVTFSFGPRWTTVRPYNRERLWTTEVQWRVGTTTTTTSTAEEVVTPKYSIRRLVRALKSAVLADDVEVTYCPGHPLRLRFRFSTRPEDGNPQNWLEFFVHDETHREVALTQRLEASLEVRE